jgi:hypothetical protein
VDYSKLITEAISVFRSNLVLAVPTILALAAGMAIWVAVGKVSLSGDVAAFAGLAVTVINFFAHGVTLEMAREAVEKGATNLRTAGRAVTGYFLFFLPAALIMGVLITVGFALYVIPGIAAIFFFMFTFPSMVVDGVGPLGAMRRSFSAVRASFADAMMLFLLLAAVSFLFSIGNMIISIIPVVGHVVGMGLSGLLGGFIALVIVNSYKILRCRVVPC